MRRTHLVLVLIASCGGEPVTPAVAPTSTATAAASSSAPPKPPVVEAKPGPLVVMLVIDQFAGWMAEERVPLLPESGGFARLRREGTWAPDMRYAHAITDTAPGHSSLCTGLSPRDSGIFANEVVDPETQKNVSILRDAKVDLVTARGNAPGFGVSLDVLTGETVADRFRKAKPNAYIVSISFKDRGALFGCGRKPDACVWYEAAAGGFVTATPFASKLPAWTPDAAALSEAASKPWELEDEAWVKKNARTPDDQPGEGGAVNGLGNTFPHKVASATEKPLSALRYTPAGDRLLLRAALDSLKEQKDRPALLSISFSTFDYVGHVWGPDSWESWDELHRLDGELGRFFAALDERYGASGWSVVLAADHGSSSMPEVPDSAHPWCAKGAPPDKLGRACGKVVRVLPAELAAELQKAAEGAIGKGDWVLGVADTYVYLSKDARALPKDKREKLDKALLAALSKRPEVAKVVPGGARKDPCPAGESLDATLCFAIGEAPKDTLYVALKPGSFFDPGHTAGKGSSHGSPYAYDRSVPLFVRAPGRANAGALVKDTVPFTSYQRTAASLLGIEAPVNAGRDFTVP